MSEVVERLQDMGFPVMNRRMWGSVRESLYTRRLQTHPAQKPARYGFGHITVTKDTGNFPADMRTLERIGFERFGTGISYTWVIDNDTGMIGEGHPLGAKGSHTVNKKNVPGFPYDLNRYGHGIALLGMPGIRPSMKFQLSFAAILRATWDEGWMTNDSPLYPHFKFAYKDCPTVPVAQTLPVIRATAIDMGVVGEMEFTDLVPGAPLDPDGTPLKVGEALLRGNHAYWQGPVEGSYVDRRLDALEAKAAGTQT